MPSSFVDSVPGVVHALEAIGPKTVLDIGPGWGKYGLMAREYFGAEVDAIEVPEGLLEVQASIYRQVFVGDARVVVPELLVGHDYDCALIIDVIEHMTKPEGHALIDRLRLGGIHVVVSTPKVFEEQHDPNNPYEEHVSLWTWEDFAPHSIVADFSTIDSIIYWLGAA